MSVIQPQMTEVADRVRAAAGPLAPTAEQVAVWQARMDRDPANILAAAVEGSLPHLLRALAVTTDGRLADELTDLCAALLAFEREVAR